mmetsp:Transcript_28860/g.43579  ORF Transcript_28860/g.43579 Transcript_28860/m.43579 type:complete len:80 (+) Transcript_28860:124-363(+)
MTMLANPRTFPELLRLLDHRHLRGIDAEAQKGQGGVNWVTGGVLIGISVALLFWIFYCIFCYRRPPPSNEPRMKSPRLQ